MPMKNDTEEPERLTKLQKAERFEGQLKEIIHGLEMRIQSLYAQLNGQQIRIAKLTSAVKVAQFKTQAYKELFLDAVQDSRTEGTSSDHATPIDPRQMNFGDDEEKADDRDQCSP